MVAAGVEARTTATRAHGSRRAAVHRAFQERVATGPAVPATVSRAEVDVEAEVVSGVVVRAEDVAEADAVVRHLSLAARPLLQPLPVVTLRGSRYLSCSSSCLTPRVVAFGADGQPG